MRNKVQLQQLGERIKALRLAAGFTQAALAYEAGVGIKTIYGLEKAEQAITVDVLISLARALNVTPAEIFKGVEIDYNE